MRAPAGEVELEVGAAYGGESRAWIGEVEIVVGCGRRYDDGGHYYETIIPRFASNDAQQYWCAIASKLPGAHWV
jgi:hypothetical protein